MPIYEFECNDCGHEFDELLRDQKAIEFLSCSNCGTTNLDKKISIFGFWDAHSNPINKKDKGGCGCSNCSGGSCSNCRCH